MSSISSMPCAAKTSSGWITVSAEEIGEIKLKYGDKHPSYIKIKDSFRCHGCYETWQEIYHREPYEYEIPTLTHRVSQEKVAFRLRRTKPSEAKTRTY